MRRILLPLLIVAFAAAAQPVQGAGAKAGAPGTNVEMPYLIAPMSKDGKLLGYAYISSKMVASSQSAAIGVRNKLAFIQDAFVRNVNAKPICKSDDPTAVDTELLNARLVADARRIVGADKVVSIVFTQVLFSPLHPGESTQDAAPPSGEAQGSGESATAPVPNQDGQDAAPAAASATSQPAQSAPH